MQTRLAALESEVNRLRSLNEKISLSVGSTPEASGQSVPMHMLDRPLSPPPENALVSHEGDQMNEDSGGSDGDF